jgi:hypothetical protein
MNTPEMIYTLIKFFFSNIWTYLGLLLLVITIRGDISKAVSVVSRFFGKIRDNYRSKIKARLEFEDKVKTFKAENPKR